MNLLEYQFLLLRKTALQVLEVRLPDRSRLMVPAMAVPLKEPELPKDYWPREQEQEPVPVPVPVQEASLALEYGFELVDPNDWHRLPVERLYPELVAPSDFVRRPVQEAVASLVWGLETQVLHPNLLACWARSIQVCLSRA